MNLDEIRAMPTQLKDGYFLGAAAALEVLLVVALMIPDDKVEIRETMASCVAQVSQKLLELKVLCDSAETRH